MSVYDNEGWAPTPPGGTQSGSTKKPKKSTSKFLYDEWAKMSFDQQRHYYRYAAVQEGYISWRDYAEARQQGVGPEEFYRRTGYLHHSGQRVKLNRAQYGKHIAQARTNRYLKQTEGLFPKYFSGGAYDRDVFWDAVTNIAKRTTRTGNPADVFSGDSTSTVGGPVVRTGAELESKSVLDQILGAIGRPTVDQHGYNIQAPTGAGNSYLAAAQAALRGEMPRVPSPGAFDEFARGQNLLASFDPTFRAGGDIRLGGAGPRAYPTPPQGGGGLTPLPGGPMSAGGFMLGPQQPQPVPIAQKGSFNAPGTGSRTYDTYTPSGGGVGDAIGGFLTSLPLVGGFFDRLTGRSAARQAALNEHLRLIQASNLKENIKLNWKSFGHDFDHHLRTWGIRGKHLDLSQQLDRARWSSEDWFRDNQFRTSQALRARAFDLGQWRTQAIGRLGDSKARFDTNIGNMYGAAVTRQQINDLWASAQLEGTTANMQHAIANGLTRTVGNIRDRLTDTKESLIDYMYAKNQQIEDQLYEASLHLDRQSSFRDVAKITDAWREKVKMEERASKKLFRGNQVQEQMYKDKIAQKQYQAQLLMSGDSRGPVEMADPIRAKRIAALAKLSGAEAMAAERLERLDSIGSAIDMAQDAFVQDPSSWGQSKQILKFFMDNLEEQ